MISRFLNIAIEQALKSELANKHGAILFTRRSILSKGYNKFLNGRQRDTSISIHAEMNCLQTIRKNVKYNKCHILVIRLNSNNKLVNSKPCQHCIESLRNTKIKNIYYSDSDGQIVCEKIKYATTTHVSAGNRFKRRW